MPIVFLTASGKVNVPVNMKGKLMSSAKGGVRGANQPQNEAAVITPTAKAASDPARDFPRLIRGV